MAPTNRRSTKKTGSSARGKGREPAAQWLRLLKTIAKWGLIVGLVCGLLAASVVAGLFWYHGRELPEILRREDYAPLQMTRVYASDGALIAQTWEAEGKRTVVPLEAVPQHVRDAFMAAEDADFMRHSGIDYLGMLRAFYDAVVHDAGIKGTSTITQQVVKNLILSPERSLERKLREILLSRELEQNLTKEDILFLYLNTIYMGHGAHGVEEGAQTYFAKSVRELTLGEAAVLAGLNQAPERWSPRKNMEGALKRRAFVLRQLWEKGFIGEATYRKTLDDPIELRSYEEQHPHLGIAPHFVEHVRKRVVEQLGRRWALDNGLEEPPAPAAGKRPSAARQEWMEAVLREGNHLFNSSGLRIYTTLSIPHQKVALEAAREGLHEYDERKKMYRPRRKLESPKAIAAHREKVQEKAGARLDPKRSYDAVVLSVEGQRVRVAVGTAHEGVLSLEPEERVLRGKKPQEVFQPGHVVRVRPAGKTSKGSRRFVFEDGPEVAVVTIDPEDREVLALVGGYSFEHNQFDHATQARRQPGSAFKPVVYAAALADRVATPATIYYDSPAVFPLPGGKNYSPKNADNAYRGPVRMREGLGASRNVVAVRVIKDVGLQRAVDFAHRIGVTSPLEPIYPLAMGASVVTPLEMTNVYATFASGGELADPRVLERIEWPDGRVERFTTKAFEAMAPEVAFLITDMMRSVIEGYTDVDGQRRGGTAGRIRKLGRPVAGKTGTTNEVRDAWFVGFTPQLVTGVWVGFDDQRRSLGRRESGGQTAAPLWLDAMKGMLEGKPKLDFQPPNTGITTAQIDPATGKLARDGGIEEYFLVGTAPTEYADPVDVGIDGTDLVLDQFDIPALDSPAPEAGAPLLAPAPEVGAPIPSPVPEEEVDVPVPVPGAVPETLN